MGGMIHDIKPMGLERHWRIRSAEKQALAWRDRARHRFYKLHRIFDMFKTMKSGDSIKRPRRNKASLLCGIERPEKTIESKRPAGLDCACIQIQSELFG